MAKLTVTLELVRLFDELARAVAEEDLMVVAHERDGRGVDAESLLGLGRELLQRGVKRAELPLRAFVSPGWFLAQDAASCRAAVASARRLAIKTRVARRAGFVRRGGRVPSRGLRRRRQLRVPAGRQDVEAVDCALPLDLVRRTWRLERARLGDKVRGPQIARRWRRIVKV